MASNTHKYVAKEGSRNFFCRRAPHGARGLKLLYPASDALPSTSRPTRGAWIETRQDVKGETMEESRPTRGAWIETMERMTSSACVMVAPHTGRVD